MAIWSAFFFSQEYRLTVEILEIRELDSLPHAEHISGGAQAIHQHPNVTGIQRRHFGVCDGGIVVIVGNGIGDISPRGNNRAHNHEAKGEKSHASDLAAKPKNLAVCNEDNGQVLEDGVDGNAQELDGPGTRVDHANEQQRYGEPFPCLVCVEIPICDETGGFGGLDGSDADDRLSS
jgi:hypothetical protein